MTVLLPLLSQSCWHNPVQVAVTIGDSNVPHVAHLPHCFVVVIPDACCCAQPQPTAPATAQHQHQLSCCDYGG